MIYLDNAATTLIKPPCVVDAVAQAMTSLGNCARGAYGSALSASRVIFSAREKLAAFFHCDVPEHVNFTANSTEALNIVLNGLIRPGDHVISTDLEHNSVLRPLYRLAERGTELSFAPASSEGTIDVEAMAELFRPNTRVLVCTHASNLTGTLLPLERIGELCRARGALFVVDASQTAGCRPIDMQRMHIDVLCFTGHKGLLGPQGTGGLCINGNIDIAPWKVGGTGVKTHLTHQPEEYPTRLEAGTLNGHGIAGLSAAVDYINSVGVETIREKETMLMRRFCEGVRGIDGIRLYGDFSCDRAPIVALNYRDYPSSQFSDELSEVYGIATRSGAHCAPRLHDALGTTEQGAVRFSFGWFNTEEEIDAAIAAVREMTTE